MSTKRIDNKQIAAVFGRLKKLRNAVQTRYPATATLQVEGHSTAQPAIVSGLDGYSALQDKVDEADSTWRRAIQDRNAALVQAKGYLETVTAAVVADKGALSSELADFGIPSRKAPKPLTVEQRVLAAARRAATRKARGTLGKKQRAALGLNGQTGLVAVTPSGAHVPILPNAPTTGEQGLVPQGPASASPSPASTPASAPATSPASGVPPAAPATSSNGSSSPGSGSH